MESTKYQKINTAAEQLIVLTNNILD